MKRIILITLLLVFPVVCFGQDAETQATPKYEEELSKEQIIEIATKEAEKEGLNLEWRTIIYDEGNKLWEEKVKTINKEMAPRYEFLKEENYQAVLFALKEGLIGGDIWIFIDKVSGEVLTLYGEE